MDKDITTATFLFADAIWIKVKSQFWSSHKMERSEITYIIEKHKKNMNFSQLYIIDFISADEILLYSSNSTDKG